MEWSQRANREWSSLATVLRPAVHEFITDEDVIRRLGATKGSRRPKHEWTIWGPFATAVTDAFKSIEFGRSDGRLARIALDRELRSLEIPAPEDAETYSVECGYNDCNDLYAKSALVPANANRFLQECRVIPNCIVHVPGHNDSNLLAIEIRKSDQQRQFYDTAHERLKMVGYTLPRLNYRFSLYLCVGVKEMQGRIHAVCLPHRALLEDGDATVQIDNLFREMRACVDELRLSRREAVALRVQRELAEIQRLLGFRDVTDSLLSDEMRPLPEDEVWFAINEAPNPFEAGLPRN